MWQNLIENVGVKNSTHIINKNMSINIINKNMSINIDNEIGICKSIKDKEKKIGCLFDLLHSIT